MPHKTKYAADCYHVRLQRKEFDPQTGKEKFPPFEQWFTRDEFKRLQDNPNGHTILEVIYDPTKAAATDETEKPARSRKS